MAHEIKLARSRKLAPHLPSAQAEIDATLSPALIAKLTGSELAEVRKCLDAHWHKAMAFAERQILAEGAIWDSRKQKMREIA